MKISKWMKGLLAFLLSFSVMFTTMIQQSVVRAEEGGVDPVEVIEEETPASSPEAAPIAEAVEAQTVSEPAAAAEETAEPAVQPAETPAVQEIAPPTESTSVPEEQVQTVKETPVVTQEEAPAEIQAYVSPASFDAEQDNIKVHADTAEGAFSEPVTLIVSLLDEDSDDYKMVQETMDQTGSSVDGLLALDIRFENSSGQEVEPVGQVSVSVVMKDAAGDVIDQSSLQVTHIKEEADGSLTPEKVADNDENTEGYIRTAGNDIQADFVAESFSTFLISRARSSNPIIYFTDTSGNSLGNSIQLTRELSGSDLTRLKTISGYQNPTVHVGSYNGTQINASLQYFNRDGGWQYTLYEGGNRDYLSGQNIYVVYEQSQMVSLTTIPTINSTSKGFHIYMVDMTERWRNDIGGYQTNGRLSQGIYGRTLYNGYPYFSARNISLKNSFSNKREVNHLFYKSTYDETGYFYFNSADTFASLQSDGTFLVSRELGSPSGESGESAFFYQRGNFLPYNSLDLNSVINHNLYDDQGKALSPSDPRYNENLYGMQQENNFGFGMHATAEFYQPVNGQVNGGEDMVYEFTGDDDMLVYIDGVLVLDLGGIHDAQSGSINFRTGTVTFTDIENKHKVDYGSSTTIYQQYELAGKLGTTQWNNSRTTFAAGTSHKIDIFYMERGAGASNLKMKVNIPPVPDGSIAVTKQVEGLDAAQAADETYRMQLKIDGSPAANKDYSLSDNPDVILYADENGQFVLKAGQTAVFSQIGAEKTVKVEEIADENTIYKVYYQRWDSAGNEITDSNDTITVPSAGHVAVTVKNNATQHTKDLTITKQFMMNGQDASDIINMDAFRNAAFTLQESADNGSNWKDLYAISYSSFKDGSYTFSQLDPRKIYRVIENATNETNGTNAAYSYAGTVSAVNNETGDKTSPHISLRDGNATVSFINNYETHKYPLTIKKIFTGVNSLPEDFRITVAGNEVFTVENAKPGGDGSRNNPYVWTVDKVPYNSTLNIRETNYSVENYRLADGTETEKHITIGSGTNEVVFENNYLPKNISFKLEKTFVGISAEEIPQNFQITDSKGNTYSLSRDSRSAVSADGLTYTWNGTAPFGTSLTFTEDPSSAQVNGYSLSASNNGSATIQKINASGNTAKITNTYTPNNYNVYVTKVFRGLDADADLSKFEIQTGLTDRPSLTKDNADSGNGTENAPYTWVLSAPYKSTVTLSETNFSFKGFTRTNNDPTEKSLTVQANDSNNVSFENVYQKNTCEDSIELPTLNILKKDDKGKSLANAEFTLYGPDGIQVWKDATNSEGKATVDFSKYQFSAEQKSYEFTLKETRAPEGYDGSSEIYHFTVNLQDNDPEIKYNERENAFQRFYHWLVGNETSASYDAASSTLTVVNTINQYPYKIVKTFSGVEALPETFEITDQNGRKYTLKDKDPVKQDNTYTYTWTGTADFGTEFQLREGNAKIHGYDLASTVNGQNGTSGTLQITTGENKIVFHNDYTAQPKKVTVTKQFNGLRAEEIPAGFAISGLGENLTLENKDSVSGSTYTWIREAAFGEQLTLRESGYEVSGYQVSAVVDGKPGTSKELTVGDDNTISFVNSYEKKYDTDDVTKPSFTIHKVDQDGRPLAGAVFSLLDAKDNVIWTAVTDGKNDLTADFTDFDFGTDPGAKFSFTLHEDAPIGYTGAEDWTITVSEDDGVVSLRKESDEDFFHKIYNWLIKDSFDKAYDQTSKVLTVTNTVNSYDFTVTKSFTGVEALPEDFQIRDTLGNVYKMDDKNVQTVNGVYTWTGTAKYKTEITFTEYNFDVDGYSVKSTANGSNGTSNKLTVTADPAKNTMAFNNVYTANTYDVIVTKGYTGIDALPDTFKITGVGNEVFTIDNVVSGTGTLSDPYVWTAKAVYGTTLKIQESGYAVSGYTTVAAVNGKAGDVTEIKVNTKDNTVAFTNSYVMNFSDANDVTKPGFILHKVDQNGKALAGAGFTLYDHNNNVVWSGTTAADGVLSVNFDSFDFGENAKAVHTFTLCETSVPEGYTGAADLTLTVKEDDGKVDLVKKDGEDYYHKVYHWVIADGLGRNYDAASNILTVTNTAIVYPFTIVKTFSGVDALPDTFVITDQNGNQYTLNDAAKQGNTYTWTGNADYGTEFRLTESGMAVHGYDLASTVNGQIETSGTLKVTAEEKNNVITFSNAYTAQPRTITVTKQFNGLTDEEVPTGFAITGLGEDLTLENAEKTGDFTYQWTRDVAYETNLTLSETGYAVSGYQVAAAVNGNPGTGIELTVGDDNSISFVNSYDKKYSEEDDVHTPSFTIHKVDQDGKLLAGAAFTLTDSNNNVVWTGTTDGENDLTADFANFDFGTDPSAKFSFTLHEDAPVGYTGAEDWTITVSEDDGVVSLRKESDKDFFHKIYNWLIKDSFDKAYDQTSKVLTVINTVNSYDFTVTKSFTGVEALPEDFQIRDTLGNVYTLDDAKSANGTYTWTGKADYGTKVTFTENGYQVNGYDVTTSVNGKDGTSAEITIGTSNNNVDFVNSYEAGTYMVRVTKSFTGVDELPDTFAITGAGENALTAADAVSGTGTADDPYVWNVEAKFGTILNIAETGYETEGYDVTATVNGNAGTSMQIQVGTGSNNVAFNNAYSLKKTDVVLSAEKNLIGRDLKAGEFSFEAYEGDQLVAEGTNDADGNITFSTIHDVTYGSHTYTLKEVNQGLGGMTYDDNAYEVTVEVIDQDGTAKAVLPETKPVFTNTYSAQDGSAVIEARKNLRGREAVNGEFSFELLQDGQVIATAVNEDGGVVFGPISWTMDEVGTYTYTIRETVGKDKNVVYDSHEETVTVTVSDNGDGTLLIETAYDKDGAVFENMYEPPVPHTDDDPKPSPEPSAPPSSDPSPVPAVPHTDDNGKTTGSSRTPQTGVSTDVTTWAWIGSSSLLALFIALILRRRKEESK